MPPLPQALAELAPGMAKLAAPVVEHVAQRLAEGQGTRAQPLTVPTLLTQGSGSGGVPAKNSPRTAGRLTWGDGQSDRAVGGLLLVHPAGHEDPASTALG
jgi:hypothetical protein